MIYSRLKHLCKTVESMANDFEYNRNIKNKVYVEAPIVDISSLGEKVGVFKNRTIEHVDFVKVYGFHMGGGMDIDYPEIDLWKIEDAIIFHSSDFVITGDGRCAWPKYSYYNYSKNIATDAFLVKEKDGILTYKKPHKIIELNSVFSMIGVCSHIWAHAIVEYLPKLCMLANAMKDSPEKLTVLIPEYSDKQLRQVIFTQLNKYDVDVLEIKNGEAVKAQILYYMQRPTIFTDHEKYVAPGDQVLPKAVIDAIRKNMIEPFVQNVKIDPKYKKIFLPRRGGFGKGIVNQDEIEQIFKEKGYEFLQPHLLTMEQKINVFQSAEVLVGPVGSAFSNFFFCRPGTKALGFSNYHRLFEHYTSAGQQYFGIDMMLVTGYDDKFDANMAHCSYYLPKERVIAAANQMGII